MIDLIKLDLPLGRVNYPEQINYARDELIKKFQAEKLAPNFKTKLVLIAEGLRLFSAQMTYENQLKFKALGVIMRDRENQRKLLNG